MSDPLDWDEFRLVRAIAEAHSLSGAADRLGLNHSTLFRRLAALEARLGLKLFERERSGYRPTAAGEDMVALASLMGDTIAEFERRVASKDVKPTGRVRVTTPAALGDLMMAEVAAGLLAEHPGLHVEMIYTDAALDLERGEADLALRRLRGAPPAGLASRKLAPLRWGVYAAASQDGASALRGPWIAMSDLAAPVHAREWLDRHIESWRRAATVNSMLSMADLAARGVGAALLPCCVAQARGGLRRIGDTDPGFDGELWLLASERALRTPRVRVAFDFIAQEMERRRAWFAGEGPAEAP